MFIEQHLFYTSEGFVLDWQTADLFSCFFKHFKVTALEEFYAKQGMPVSQLLKQLLGNRFVSVLYGIKNMYTNKQMELQWYWLDAVWGNPCLENGELSHRGKYGHKCQEIPGNCSDFLSVTQCCSCNSCPVKKKHAKNAFYCNLLHGFSYSSYLK